MSSLKTPDNWRSPCCSRSIAGSMVIVPDQIFYNRDTWDKKKVSILKEIIKKKNVNSFGNFDSKQLDHILVARPQQNGTYHFGLDSNFHSRIHSEFAQSFLSCPSDVGSLILVKRRLTSTATAQPPSKMLGTVPVALLHPVFGRFQDDLWKVLSTVLRIF